LWYLVAFGMIGTNTSGITFISVPGAVGASAFGYFQFILGNAAGYVLIATILLPLYYRVNLISIYTYLGKRLGFWSYKSGAMIFLVSRTIGSALRLYLIVIVLQKFIFDALNVPFWLTVSIVLVSIWFYTFKGGLKTIVITDTLQTLFLLVSVILSIWFIAGKLDLNLVQTFETIKNSSYSKIFFWNDFSGNDIHFIKQFMGGIFVTITMTGLDQDLMQKNLSCKNLPEAQKNMFTFTGIFVVINIFFLAVGALLYLYADFNGMDVNALRTPDYLFPEIALNHISIVPAVIFMIGLTASTFATTDSALTALTTSFCVDFLGFDNKENQNDRRLVRTRYLVHFALSFIILVVVIIFRIINNDSVVNVLFRVAGYTYGPLLGLFSFGMISKRAVRDRLIPFICLIAPTICLIIDYNSMSWIGYSFGFEMIVINGLITYLLMLSTSKGISSFKLSDY
jgi:Na+/proline symporter